MRTTATRLTVIAGLLIALPLGAAGTAVAKPVAELSSSKSDDGGGIGMLHIAIGGAVIGNAAAGAAALWSRRRVS